MPVLTRQTSTIQQTSTALLTELFTQSREIWMNKDCLPTPLSTIKANFVLNQEPLDGHYHCMANLASH